MPFVVTPIASSIPTLTQQEVFARLDALKVRAGFLGVKPGNPPLTLWETEADAAAQVEVHLGQPNITSAEITPLETLGLAIEDFNPLG